MPALQQRSIPIHLRIDASKSHRSLDLLIVTGLTIISLILFTINLGHPSLQGWGEATVAQVAKEIVQLPDGFWQGVSNLTLWGESISSEPPLIYGAMALSFKYLGISEWSARIPGATLGALSVPFFYWLGREVFDRWCSATFATMVYLTLLPVLQQGRLAMADGATLCFFVIILGMALRARRNVHWSFGVGAGLSLICLSQGLGFGLVLGLILLFYLNLDTPTILRNQRFWIGLGIGLYPASAWYVKILIPEQENLRLTSLSQNLLQLLEQPLIASKNQTLLTAIRDSFQWSWPWLLFIPIRTRQLWRRRRLGWGMIVWAIGGPYLFAIMISPSPVFGYNLLLYPICALFVGAQLTSVWDRVASPELTAKYNSDTGFFISSAKGQTSASMTGLGLLGSFALLGACYGFVFDSVRFGELVLPLLLAAFVFISSYVLALRKIHLWLPWLSCGWLITLMAFMASPHWVFVPSESAMVERMGGITQSQTVIQSTEEQSLPVYITNSSANPALDFYSERQIKPICEYIKSSSTVPESFYLWLKSQSQTKLLGLTSPPLGQVEGWQLQGPLKLDQLIAEDTLKDKVANYCQIGLL